MKLRRRTPAEAEVDMTPMIDMVFLLLVFFMCAATMSKVDFTPEIKLPVAPKSNVPEDLRGRGTINILPVGHVLSNGAMVPEDRPYMVYGNFVSKKDLGKLIEGRRGGDADFRVYMRVHREVEFASVRDAIKACAEVGVFDIIFATYQSRVGE